MRHPRLHRPGREGVHSYDAAGRLSQMTSNGIGGAVVSLTYAWDRNSNLKSATTTQGGVTASSTNFTHNADGSMASAATTGQSPRAYSYSPAGTMTTDGCSNYILDGFDRVSEVGAASPQGVGCASIPHLWYYYDALNRQAEHVDSISGQHVFDAYAGFGRNVLVEHQ